MTDKQREAFGINNLPERVYKIFDSEVYRHLQDDSDGCFEVLHLLRDVVNAVVEPRQASGAEPWVQVGDDQFQPQPPKAVPDGKYSDVLTPFLHMMEKELHANSGKGDREGWLSMTKDQCMLEIYYHAAKLQKAVKKSDIEGTKEYAADVANMCMMMVDICGDLTMPTPTDHPGPSTTAFDDQEAPDE